MREATIDHVQQALTEYMEAATDAGCGSFDEEDAAFHAKLLTAIPGALGISMRELARKTAERGVECVDGKDQAIAKAMESYGIGIIKGLALAGNIVHRALELANSDIEPEVEQEKKKFRF